MAKSESKEAVLQRLCNMLQGQGMFIREDTTMTSEEKLEQMDVVIDVLHFLNDYDENVKVLNEYWVKKRYAEKFAQGKTDFERDD